MDTEKPKQQDIEALRECLRVVPDLWRGLMDLVGVTEGLVMGELDITRSMREGLEVGLQHLKEELGYSTAPMLEKLLIEQVALCWLRQNIMEIRLAGLAANSATLEQGEYWEKRLSATQRRYLRACETLVRVRKLGTLPLQVNIAAAGGQQVNVINPTDARSLPLGP
ncbi:MAG: hypothetical protein WCI87_06960 [Euryarchaeota archaeon]